VLVGICMAGKYINPFSKSNLCFFKKYEQG